MKGVVTAAVILFTCLTGATQTEWKPVPGKIATQWAAGITPENAWQEYPRPQLVRNQWLNLNGLWNYAIVPKGQSAPTNWDGRILVPYCVESSLSGVGRKLTPDHELWYQRSVSVPAAWKARNLIMHFGAVDWDCTLYINGKKAGSHQGGSDPFSFDITPYINNTASAQQLVLRVWDPTDSDIQPRGKQTLNPQGFWYTAVSGIWQTVWLEPVNAGHLNGIEPVSNIDNQTVELKPQFAGVRPNDVLEAIATLNGQTVYQGSFTCDGSKMIFPVKAPQLWEPGHPSLYQLQLRLLRNGQELDKVSSYFAMRKISMGKDPGGITRILLNNRPLFQWGTLDQGWWPESLLTPPSDRAMRYDLEVLQSLGFNMVRKHIKVEPARYYYAADSMGMLLWQDMPSGFLNIQHPEQHVKFDAPSDWDRPRASAEEFKQEWASIMNNLRFFPSIVTWVPFNEGWGQFDTRNVAAWTAQHDPTRLVDAASGWTDRNIGNFYDVHQYPGPSMEPAEQNPNRAMVLGEFGGHGLPVKGHLWDESKRNWGYRNYMELQDFRNEYAQSIRNVYPLIARGLSAAIYTQTTDVEGEVNGLMTYDRKVLKVVPEEALAVHRPLFEEQGQVSFLVKDSELEPSLMHVSKIQPGKNWNLHNPFDSVFQNHTGVYTVNKGDHVWAVNSFMLTGMPKGLAMKLYAKGDLRITINGTEVYNRKILTKRHYDEYNLSKYIALLKPGKNVIGLELTNTDDSDLDFGVYSFQ